VPEELVDYWTKSGGLVSSLPEDEVDVIGGVRFAKWRLDANKSLTIPGVWRWPFCVSVLGCTVILLGFFKFALLLLEAGKFQEAGTVFLGGMILVLFVVAVLLRIRSRRNVVSADKDSGQKWQVIVGAVGSESWRGTERGELLLENGFLCFRGKTSSFCLKQSDFLPPAPTARELLGGSVVVLETPAEISPVTLKLTLERAFDGEWGGLERAVTEWLAKPPSEGPSLYPPARSKHSVLPWVGLFWETIPGTVTAAGCIASLLLVIPSSVPNAVPVVVVSTSAALGVWILPFAVWFMGLSSRSYDREVEMALELNPKRYLTS